MNLPLISIVRYVHNSRLEKANKFDQDTSKEPETNL